MPVIRRMTAADLPAVTRVLRDSFPGKVAAASPGDHELAARMFALAALASGDAWVADDGDVAGVVTLQDRRRPWYRHAEWRLLRGIRPRRRGLRLMAFFTLFHSVDFPPEELYLETIAVGAEARGLGTGSALLTFVEDEAGRRGRTSVSLYCIRDNPRARALYVRRGYRIVLSEDLWWCRPVLGFRITDMMRLDLGPAEPVGRPPVHPT